MMRTSDAEPEPQDAIAGELAEISAHVRSSSRRREGEASRADPRFALSARNLACYLALRELEVRPLQGRLARAGLSSLGHSESHVLASLDAVGRAAEALDGRPRERAHDPAISPAFGEGSALLAAHAEVLLGPASPGRRTRIMVTMPSEAADDEGLVRDLVSAGMDCARINLAHDDEDLWRGMVRNIAAATPADGHRVRIAADLPGPKLRTGPIGRDPSGDELKLRVAHDDILVLTAAPEPGRAAVRAGGGETARAARISCTLPEVFTHVRPGEPVFIDDGKIAAVVEDASSGEIRLRITGARQKGQRVRGGKGISFPRTHLPISCLTEYDLARLPFLAECADIVEVSFVQDPADVRALRARLTELGAPEIGLVLKVETVRAFERLPDLLFAGMEGPSLGVMIARGDLAVEVGFERLAEVQEEILWLGEAAHVPVIWATEVLDSLAHTGRVTRAEVTDAGMGARAEAVMLNKGPCIVDAVRALDGILGRMQDHHAKKTSLLRPLRAWGRDPRPA